MKKNVDVQTQPSCEDGLQSNLISVKSALEKILGMITPISKTESVPLRDALGRVLANNLHSPIDVPNHTNCEKPCENVEFY